MGRGIVEQTGDWEKSKPTHPELLRWLGRELVRNDYSLKAIARLIFNSHAYQRTVDPELRETSPLFTSPAPRRLQARANYRLPFLFRRKIIPHRRNEHRR